jgi:hypothetical protein
MDWHAQEACSGDSIVFFKKILATAYISLFGKDSFLLLKEKIIME